MSSSPPWSSWTAATSRMSSTRWPFQNFSLSKFDGGIPQREWRMVAQALSVPRYDFAMAHIPTSRSVQPQIQQEPLLNPPLSGWTQARYARSHRVQFGEAGHYLHCTNGAIVTRLVNLVLALRNMSVHPKT